MVDGSRRHWGRRSLGFGVRPRPDEAGDSTGRALIKKALLSFLGIGVIGSVIGGSTLGTFSKFTATVTNPTNSFAAGTLLMTNGSCSSVSSGSSCGTFTLSSGNNGVMVPGDIVTGTFTLSNVGSLAASSMKLTLTNLSATSSLNTFINLTIFDSTSGYCIHGTSQTLPFHGSCDSLTGLTAQQTNDAFAAVSNLSVPAVGGGSSWSTSEAAHTLTVTAQLAINASVVAGSTASIDFQWTGAQ